ncbi:TRAF3-interacting JNK-activating modulator isoform X3 [Erinaceus europaeus]|nr:TRAF3-interacting JNK-activating modulator isoform X3 [Erinaceus europaeus]
MEAERSSLEQKAKESLQRALQERLQLQSTQRSLALAEQKCEEWKCQCEALKEDCSSLGARCQELESRLHMLQSKLQPAAGSSSRRLRAEGRWLGTWPSPHTISLPFRAAEGGGGGTGGSTCRVCLGCRPSGRWSRTDGWRRKVAHLPPSPSCPSGREGWAREHLTRQPPTWGKETGGPPRPLQAVRVESFNKRTELVSTSMRTQRPCAHTRLLGPRPQWTRGRAAAKAA